MSEWKRTRPTPGGAKPIMRARSPVRITRPRRRWSGVSWWFSLLFVIGAGAWIATYFIDMRDDNRTSATPQSLVIAVTDVTNGAPLAGAEVRAGAVSVLSDDAGIAQLAAPMEPVVITVSLAGYQPVYGEANGDMALNQAVALTPAPPENDQSEPAADSPSQTEPGAATADDDASEGTDEPVETPATEPTDVPEETPTAEGDGVDLAAGSSTGVVLGMNGAPVDGATIVANGVVAHSQEDGSFELDGVAPGTEVQVWAPGYADAFVALPEGEPLEVQLTRQDIKAAYLTGARLSDRAKIDELIGLTQTTELNAIVVDLKEGDVYYDTRVQFFHDAGAVNPVFDPAALVQEMNDQGIYTIARIVVFNDPVVAAARPDLAVQDVNGGTWVGYNGAAWVNPFLRDLWQPNIDLAIEAAEMGFDEIQYDYVRFPSDGDLTTAEFGAEYDYSEEGRVGTIVEFLAQSKAALEPLGAKLAADVFGIIAVYPEDQGIGQRLPDFAEVVDYVCPMAYPSHFNVGSIGVDGEPNDFPYETLEITIGLGMAKIPGQELKMRPWIQDFTWGEREYGPDEVRAQINATMEQGASGWMLWNAGSAVTVGALEPEG